MLKHKTYENGLNLIVKEGGAISCSFAIVVGTGSVNENAKNNGISHFLEHLAFKGTKNYTVLDIPEIMESAGVNFNAYTSNEITAYHAQTIKEQLEKSFSIMSEMAFSSIYPEEEVEKERGVIIEEINMGEDMPDDVCYELAQKAYFGANGYGRTILGPKKNIEKLGRQDFFDYLSDYYVAENTAISFVGNVTFEEADRLVQTYLMPIIKTGKKKKSPKINTTCKGEHLARNKDVEQVQLMLKFPAHSALSPKNIVNGTMCSVLGGGMSSRLFRKIREELGLAYSVGAYGSAYKHAGTVNIYAGVNPQKYLTAYDAIMSVIKDFQDKGVTEKELVKVKNQVKSSMIFSQERPQTLALLYARYYLIHGELYDFDKRLAEIDAITSLDINEEISMLSENLMASAVVGKDVKPLK